MAIAITFFFQCCFFLVKFLYFLLFLFSVFTVIDITIFYLCSLCVPMPSKVLFLCLLNSHGFLCCLCSPATLPLPECCFFFTFFLSHFFTALLLFSNPPSQTGVPIPIFCSTFSSSFTVVHSRLFVYKNSISCKKQSSLKYY